MSECKISIIIPVYNKEKYLDKCLQSVLSQTFKDYEVICVDDGSTDLSLSILNEYANDNNKFKVFTKTNEGPGSARNYGLDKSCGEYVLFLDADDYLIDDTLNKLYATVENNNYPDLVLFNGTELYKDKTKDRIYHIHADKNTDFNNFTFDYNNNINLVMNGYLIVCTKLHRLSFIKQHNLKFSNTREFEDVQFHIKSMIYAKSIAYNPNKFYQYYRKDEDSRQNNTITTNRSFTFFDIFEEVYDFLQEEKLFSKFEVNYYKFVTKESFNIYNRIKNEYKEEYFDKVKYKFTTMDLNNEMIHKLPLNLQGFYVSVIESKTINELDNRMIKENVTRKTKSSLRNLKNKIFKH